MYVPSPGERLKMLKAVLSNRNYTATEKNVAGYLLTCQNSDTGVCNASYETIAAALGIERRSVIRAVKAIEAAGDLTIEAHKNGDGTSFAWLSNQFNFAFTGAQTANCGEPVEFSHPPSDPRVTTPPAPSDSAVTPLVTPVSPPLVTPESPKQGKKNNVRRTQASLFDGRDQLTETLAFNFESWFEGWWQQYPVDEGKKEAKKTCERIIRKGETTPDELLAGVVRYAASDKVRRGFAMLADKWLKGARWNDGAATRTAPQPARSSVGIDAILDYGARKREARG
jgi:hypothetical protein